MGQPLLLEATVGLLISWLILSCSVWLTSKVVPGFELEEGFGNAVLIAAMFGVLNATLGFVLFHLIGITTLFIGYILAFVTRAIVSAIVLTIVDKMSDKLKIESFPVAIASGIAISIGGAIGDWIAR